MAASINDMLTKVGTPGTATSLQSPGKAIGATSINIGSAANWPTDTAVFFAMRVIDPSKVSATNPSGLVAGTYTEWKGVISGTTITNLTLQYGSDQVYTAGTNTQVFIPVASGRENSIVTWGLTQHKQDGTHGAVTATSVDTPILKDNGTQLSTIRNEALTNFVVPSGLVWSIASGLNATMTAGTMYIAGVRITVASIASHAFTASKDTYVDINSTGTALYTEVANGAAAPALTAGYIRVAKVVTGASTISSIVQEGIDSLGNLIYPSGSIGGSSIQSYKVNRQDDTTNSIVTNARIETGWGVAPVTSGQAGISEVVNFRNSFKDLPIVTCTFGGDNATLSTYGNGGANIKACHARAVSVTRAGFAAIVSTADNSNYTSNGYIFYQWVAIGA